MSEPVSRRTALKGLLGAAAALLTTGCASGINFSGDAIIDAHRIARAAKQAPPTTKSLQVDVPQAGPDYAAGNTQLFTFRDPRALSTSHVFAEHKGERNYTTYEVEWDQEVNCEGGFVDQRNPANISAVNMHVILQGYLYSMKFRPGPNGKLVFKDGFFCPPDAGLELNDIVHYKTKYPKVERLDPQRLTAQERQFIFQSRDRVMADLALMSTPQAKQAPSAHDETVAKYSPLGKGLAKIRNKSGGRLVSVTTVLIEKSQQHYRSDFPEAGLPSVLLSGLTNDTLIGTDKVNEMNVTEMKNLEIQASQRGDWGNVFAAARQNMEASESITGQDELNNCARSLAGYVLQKAAHAGRAARKFYESGSTDPKRTQETGTAYKESYYFPFTKINDFVPDGGTRLVEEMDSYGRLYEVQRTFAPIMPILMTAQIIKDKFGVDAREYGPQADFYQNLRKQKGLKKTSEATPAEPAKGTLAARFNKWVNTPRA